MRRPFKPLERVPPKLVPVKLLFDSMAALSPGLAMRVAPHSAAYQEKNGREVLIPDWRDVLPMRIESFFVERDDAPNFIIQNIFIGDHYQIASDTGVDARVFDGRSDVQLLMEMIQEGCGVAIEVTNYSAKPARFRARFLGLSMATGFQKPEGG